LLTLCGVCSGGFCFGVLLGQSASQSPLGRAKRNTGRALCRWHCVSQFVFKNSLFVFVVFSAFVLFALPARNSPKTKAKFLMGAKILPHLKRKRGIFSG
jgi:hypothetical protein